MGACEDCRWGNFCIGKKHGQCLRPVKSKDGKTTISGEKVYYGHCCFFYESRNQLTKNN